MNIFSLLAGLILLFMGRKFFWLFVGLVGFASGFYTAQYVFAFNNLLVTLILSIGLGLLGALMAIFVQRIAVFFSGFMAGWYFTRSFLIFAGLSALPFLWLVALAGGIIGAVLLSMAFDYALIVLSAAVGALAIIHSNFLLTDSNIFIFIVLFFIGLIFQIRIFRTKKA
ncbi:hypothetical protein JXQ31_11100 [candidate division KSB1 bacterium]|nr:hypothetical protein [candidate division KSB1 bacterium]